MAGIAAGLEIGGVSRYLSVPLAAAAVTALALTPLAGHLASTLFAVGLVGAGLLAAAILPLSTSYSVSEAFGKEGRIAGNLRTEPIFFLTYIAMTALGAAIVLIPAHRLSR